LRIAAIALIVITMMWFVGVRPFLLVHVPITLLAASVGVWLFCVQHQFEHTFWDRARRGAFTRQRSTAAPTMTCRAPALISASTTCATYAAGIHFAGFNASWTITPSSRPPGG
jgi:hypothetical protein